MRWLLALSFLLWSSLATAQPSTIGSGHGPVTYQGPGDVVASAAAWWGLRAYSAAFAATGGAAINLRRSDNRTCDVLVEFSGGLGVTANCSNSASNNTTIAQFCNATTCFAHELYDQTGNGRHLIQATNANQPTLVQNCLGTLPCLSSAGAAVTIIVTSSNFTPTAGVATISTVGLVSYSTGTPLIVQENASSGNRLGVAVSGSDKLIGGTSGSISATATNNVFHVVNAVLNGSSSVVNVDGTETTGTATGNTTAGTAGIMNNNNSGNTVKVAEAGFWNNLAATGTDRTNLCHNQYLYWGTGTSC